MARVAQGLAWTIAAALVVALVLPATAGIKGEQPVEWSVLAGLDVATGKVSDGVKASLGKKTLRLRGYAVPVEVSDFDNIKEFILVPTLFGCCQGPPPDTNQIIEVTLSKPVGFDKLSDAVYLAGKLQMRKGGTGEYVYAMEGAEVFEPEFDF
jgi:hypothetical protein